MYNLSKRFVGATILSDHVTQQGRPEDHVLENDGVIGAVRGSKTTATRRVRRIKSRLTAVLKST